MNLVSALPSISIVVPNRNGAATLERTLQSLVAQRYAQLQIVVIDGGSTDGSVEIIRRYQRHLDFWVSEPDTGQSNAINKGFARCRGKIVNWLCSDDVLAAGALDVVGRHFAENPECDVLVGSAATSVPDIGLRFVTRSTPDRIRLMPSQCLIAQPSTFFRRELLDRPQPLDESLHYAMDLELWCYFKSRGVRWECNPRVLSQILVHANAKNSTGGEKMIAEIERIYAAYVPGESIPLTWWHRRLRLPLERLRKQHRHRRVFPRALKLAEFAIVLGLAPFYGYRRAHAMNWYSWA